MHFNRRQFVWTLGAGLSASLWPPLLEAGEDGAPEAARSLYERYQGLKVPSGQGGGYGVSTSGDIAGPFYRKGAPFQAKLAAKGEPGRRLSVRGFVVKGPECAPVPNAILDVWQATAKGRYDNDDPRNPPAKGSFKLRGKIKTDAKGRFEFLTIWPGRYKIGPNRWRPAHLHLTVTAPGCEELTTQLYFAGDPHNAKDPWFKASRALKPKEDKEHKLWIATYEVVLKKTPAKPASRPNKR
ncbi:MAG: twin-arginine translocation pathway signal protein [Planctomycetes bacterium]|nr:twin-arginine translocation pathway signal protein [Planctomycetota bacterium]